MSSNEAPERCGRPPEGPKRILLGGWGGGYSEEPLSTDWRIPDPAWPFELQSPPKPPVRHVGRKVVVGGGGLHA